MLCVSGDVGRVEPSEVLRGAVLPLVSPTTGIPKHSGRTPLTSGTVGPPPVHLQVPTVPLVAKPPETIG